MVILKDTPTGIRSNTWMYTDCVVSRTIYRGTFRRPGFCRTWDIFVQLGATDDSYYMENVSTSMTHRDFINSFLSYNPKRFGRTKTGALHASRYRWPRNVPVEMAWDCLKRSWWASTRGPLHRYLEHILKKKWSLNPDDKDMIVMWHKFDFIEGDKHREIHSTMVAIGDDATNTAMSKTVGLPLGIAARHILTGNINLSGVQIPIIPELYNPILDELVNSGIELSEKTIR